MLVALTLGLAIVVAVIALFMGVFLVMEPDKEMTSRLLSLTTSAGEAPEPDESQGKIGGKLNKPVGKAMNRLGLSGNIAHKLAQANMAITPSEYYIITAGLMLGAQGVWMGTRFVASPAWGGADWEQQAVLAAPSDDTVQTNVFERLFDRPFPVGIADRMVRNPFIPQWPGPTSTVASHTRPSP